MGSEEYKRLYQLYLYVFSTPSDSEEREKRLAEISDEDSEKLWDFYSGLCSGRIKPENINKESVHKHTPTFGGVRLCCFKWPAGNQEWH